jgi:hypothetical protein
MSLSGISIKCILKTNFSLMETICELFTRRLGLIVTLVTCVIPYVEHAVKSYDMRPTALLPLQRKSCYGFLWPLKMNCPGLNPRTLSPLASTITTRPPITTP